MRLHARHGWGYNARFWAPLATLLGELRRDDRGYHGEALADPIDPERPHVLVGHSLGAMRMLAEAGPGCRGLVAINGFDRFTAASGFPGVARRVVERMRHRCLADPAGTVADFRTRCGDADRPTSPLTRRLHDDLGLLCDGDARRALSVPLLRLDGAADPILLPTHRAACFAGASAREAADGGHLLPLSHPRWCAEAIAGFVATLA